MENKAADQTAITSFIFKGRVYPVIRFLGHGKGGYSYLVKDPKGETVVLKKIHHEPCSYYTFGDKLQAELRDYQMLKPFLKMPALLDYDPQSEILIKEYIEGDNVMNLVQQGRDMTDYIAQMGRIAQSCYERGLNIDYYPNNFIVHEDQLYYVDFECNQYMAEWSFENWGIQYWRRSSEEKPEL